MEDAAKPRLDATARSGGRPQAGSREASARPFVSGNLCDPLSNVEAVQRRYERRAVAARFLTADVFEREHVRLVDGEYVNEDTGELVDRTSVYLPRPARCGWRINGGNVYVHGDAETGISHLSNVQHCSSCWVCPIDAATIRRQRSLEIQAAVDRWQSENNELLFMTLTMRHKREDGLKMCIDAVMGGWRRMTTGKVWKRFLLRWHVSGWVRSIEVTWSQANGWHVHAHVLVFCTGKALSPSKLEQFSGEIWGRWSRYLTASSSRTPDRVHGVDVRRVDSNGAVLAQYLGKLQEEKGSTTGVAYELSRTDLKASHASDSYVPFQFLDNDSSLPEPLRRRLFCEFYRATKGRKAITWSRNLRAELDLDAEKTDEQIIEAAVSQAPIVCEIPAKVFDRARREQPGVFGLVLAFAAKKDGYKMLPLILPGIICRQQKRKGKGADDE